MLDVLAALELGIDEDDVVAMQLGASDVSKLSEVQQVYVDKIKTKLAQVHSSSWRPRKLPKMATPPSTGDFSGWALCMGWARPPHTTTIHASHCSAAIDG